MQSISWYVNRLKSMSPDEILWRVNALGIAQIDRMRVTCGFLPEPEFKSDVQQPTLGKPTFRLCDHPPSCWSASTGFLKAQIESAWRPSLLAEAEKIRQRRLSYFNLEDVYIGDHSGWHRDHSSGRVAPVIHINRINYRDFKQVGDCKLVWEPNRHHQLVVLARAYRATGNEVFARGMVEQMASWIEANPFGKGMNWRSPLELGIRLINWVWAIDTVLESDALSESFQEQLITCIYQHCWEIFRKLSKGSSANNHLVGEAAGLYIGALYCDFFHQSAFWKARAKHILETEIHAQSYDDGCTREQALGYQFFVMQFYLLAGIAGRRAGDEFSPEYWQRLECMLSFVARLTEGGALPMFGDRDDGYVINLGDTVDDVNAWMDLGYRLFNNEYFLSQVQQESETSYWLLGAPQTAYTDILKKTADKEHSDNPETDKPARESASLSSQRLGESGYYLLQYGSLANQDKVSMMIDCAELGYKSIAAHGHADALSFILRLNDLDCLVDTGTYDYFSYSQWRNYFRSTRAHNTLEVDGKDQSEMLGPFLWGAKANARCLDWSPDSTGGVWVGTHDGYRRLDDPVTHTRHLKLDGSLKQLQIRDEVLSASGHTIAIYFHFSEYCQLKEQSENTCVFDLQGRKVILEIDPRLMVAILEGRDRPMGGWLSRGYHQKVPVVTVVAQGRTSQEDNNFVCRVSW